MVFCVGGVTLLFLSLRQLLLLLTMVDVEKQSEKKIETSDPVIELDEDKDRESDCTRNSGVSIRQVQDGEKILMMNYCRN